jgi:hypothetical protein
VTGRAKALFEAGLGAFQKSGYTNDHIAALSAVAVMIDQALPAKREPKRDGAAYMRGKELFDYLSVQCARDIQFEPCTASSMSVAGKALRDGNVSPSDVKLLAQWIAEGGLGWMRTKPTWLQVSRKLLEWVAQAKAEMVPAAEPTSSPLDRLRGEGSL